MPPRVGHPNLTLPSNFSPDEYFISRALNTGKADTRCRRGRCSKDSTLCQPSQASYCRSFPGWKAEGFPVANGTSPPAAGRHRHGMLSVTRSWPASVAPLPQWGPATPLLVPVPFHPAASLPQPPPSPPGCRGGDDVSGCYRRGSQGTSGNEKRRRQHGFCEIKALPPQPYVPSAIDSS